MVNLIICDHRHHVSHRLRNHLRHEIRRLSNCCSKNCSCLKSVSWCLEYKYLCLKCVKSCCMYCCVKHLYCNCLSGWQKYVKMFLYCSLCCDHHTNHVKSQLM